ncbi:MAG: HAMP domain-containing sensor histidine kinase [Candidatus Gastranaerophilaceae bacterium]|jgi:signal transduction histidine kinase
MFKFAKYFFFVFLITTVIPFFLMFLWAHQRVEHIRSEREQHFLELGIKQLKNTTNQYLKIQESSILEKIQNLLPQQISAKYMQHIFKTAKIEWINNTNIDKMTSYYEVIKSNPSSSPILYSVLILPLNNSSIKGIKITNKVDISQLRPAGPFTIEIYAGDDISKNSFIGAAQDPFLITDINFHHIKPAKPLNDEFKNRKNKTGEIKITNNKGKTVATLIIKHDRHPSPLGSQNSVDNTFGLVILLAGSVLSLLIGFYINRNFIKPLLVLSNASKKVQNGDVSFELVTNIKEKQILNTFNNFNQMIIGLKEKEEIRKSFITSLTHDLRTPLIAQERALDFIAKKFETLDLNEDYELAKSLKKDNKHLLRMVNLILESYQFDSEKLNLRESDINISELADDCYEKLKFIALEKNIQFLNNIPKDFPVIKGDLICFKRIFVNLISNAIENISQNDKIEINAQSYDNFVQISVEDNGPGIAPADLAHIFDRYYTGKSFERKLGAGLGLHVCQKLTELHNGKITAESEINKYTKFIIQLPLNIQEDKDKKLWV